MLQGWWIFHGRLQKSIDEIESLLVHQETLSVKDSNDEVDPVPLEKTDNKMLFVYQSKDMQILYQWYGKHLMLLYATYKTTKYSLQLHFLVVQTNVNYQVAAVIIAEEETKCMLSKALQIIKSNFNTLNVIVSFSFLITLFSTNTLSFEFGFHLILEHMFQEK